MDPVLAAAAGCVQTMAMDSWVTVQLSLVLAFLLWLRIRLAEHEGAQRCTRLLLEEARQQLDVLQADCRGDAANEDYRFGRITTSRC